MTIVIPKFGMGACELRFAGRAAFGAASRRAIGGHGSGRKLKKRVAPGAKGALTGIALKIMSVAIFVAMSSCIKAAGDRAGRADRFLPLFFRHLPDLALPGLQATSCEPPSSPSGRSTMWRAASSASASMGLGFFALTQPAAAGGDHAELCAAAAGGGLLLALPRRDDPRLSLERGGGRTGRGAHHFLAGTDAADRRRRARRRGSAGRRGCPFWCLLRLGRRHLLVRNLVHTREDGHDRAVVFGDGERDVAADAAVRLAVADPDADAAADRGRLLRRRRADPDDLGLSPRRGLDGRAVRIHVDDPRPSSSAIWFSATFRPSTCWSAVSIVVGAGIFIIWRERQLGLERCRPGRRRRRAAADPRQPSSRSFAFTSRKSRHASFLWRAFAADRPDAASASPEWRCRKRWCGCASCHAAAGCPRWRVEQHLGRQARRD